jgi:hypothetical protein
MFGLHVSAKSGPGLPSVWSVVLRRSAEASATIALLVGGSGCTGNCPDQLIHESLEGPMQATAGTEPLLIGKAIVVAPGVNKPDGRFVMVWPSSPFNTQLLIPKLRFGKKGTQPAESLGAVLCWCPVTGCPGNGATPGEPGARCIQLMGSLTLTRYDLVDTELGKERDIDLVLDASGTDQDATAEFQIHFVLDDEIVTHECDRLANPTF